MKSIMRILFTFIGLLMCVGMMAQPTPLKYRVYLKDKNYNQYSLDKPEEFLSARSLERRKRQNIAVDYSDLPVSQAYINEIYQTGGNPVTKGKWNNFVTVSVIDSIVAGEIGELPFVKKVELVWVQPPANKPSETVKRDTLINRPTKSKDYYGLGDEQITMCNGKKLHEAGFKGEGMMIAVIDAGYHNMDLINAMKNIKVAGVKDLVKADSDIYMENNHGLGVLSCMAMNAPGIMVGTAPESEYLLLRSEDAYSEQLVEQDYWAAAVEYADSIGADLVNTSLGYYAFDNPLDNYHYRDLDGSYTLISRQASMVADKGMVMVCSAGNSGAGSWKKITPPGDAHNVLTIGAVEQSRLLAPFSSVGNTADGRIKPDVVAMGALTQVMGTDGNIRKANGTSFASPIICGLVACLWQALPHLNALEVMDLVRKAGDRAQYPDNIYGYGIPDFWKAYELKQ